MPEINREVLSKLSNDHWKYVEKTLLNHGTDEKLIEICGYHYLTAFEHGYKHGVEAMQ